MVQVDASGAFVLVGVVFVALSLYFSEFFVMISLKQWMLKILISGTFSF